MTAVTWSPTNDHLCPICGESIEQHESFREYNSSCIAFLRQRIERLEQAMSELAKKIDDKERPGA